jgi:hypothetical protein
MYEVGDQAIAPLYDRDDDTEALIRRRVDPDKILDWDTYIVLVLFEERNLRRKELTKRTPRVRSLDHERHSRSITSSNNSTYGGSRWQCGQEGEHIESFLLLLCREQSTESTPAFAPLTTLVKTAS